MNAKKCDRCGNFYIPKYLMYQKTNPGKRYVFDSIYTGSNSIDLYPECLDWFMKWMLAGENAKTWHFEDPDNHLLYSRVSNLSSNHSEGGNPHETDDGSAQRDTAGGL